MSRPAGAASRLVGLQTPPSTYSRSPIATGANSHGTVHEASTASATVARGAPGCRTPRAGPAAGPRRRPAGARQSGRPSARPGTAGRPASGRGGGPRSSSDRITAPPGAATPRASGAKSRRRRARTDPARRAAASAATARPPARAAPTPTSSLVPTPTAGAATPATRWAATIAPAEVRRTTRSHAGPSRPRPRCLASTPIIQASPSTPPPPSTRHRVGNASGAA